MSRQSMPGCAAIIDDLRDVFGQAEIDSVIRRGLKPECQPEHKVWFSEGGQELGRRYTPVFEISVAQMVIGPAPVVETGQRGRQ